MLQRKQNEWLDSMNKLKMMHSDIAKLIDGKKVAYIDCPVYFNFGDLLICQGTEQFFKDYDINVIYRSEASFVKQSELNKCDVILYQGGGNFGDLYPRVQKMRESVLLKNREKRIICLPQTIHFEDQTNFDNAVNIFNEHKDFHFFVRDQNSELLGRSFSDNVYLSPDMAHSLHPLVESIETGKQSQETRILVQKRNDDEANNHNFPFKKRSFDWLDLVRVEDKVVVKLFRLLSYLGINQNKLIKFWYMKADELQLRALYMFESKSLIVTDRLHGMILSSLLGKECTVFDNSYGKNKGYYDEWLYNIDFITMNK